MIKAGLGIRSELFGPIETALPQLGFLEAHSENFFGESIARAKLLNLRENYPISLHGVGLSLGRADELDSQHLAQLKHLVDDVEPIFVSEHLAWSAYAHRHIPDLLPLPLNTQALNIICQHIEQMQTALGCQVFIENPSNYLLFEQLQIPEAEFLNLLAQKTGCGLLMDINNIYVSATNVGRDACQYIDSIDSQYVAQYHLAGFEQVTREHNGETETLLIDSHNRKAHDSVWNLYQHALKKHGVHPTLFEWDSDFPEFSILQAECDKANTLMSEQLNNDQAGVLKASKSSINDDQSFSGLAALSAQEPLLAKGSNPVEQFDSNALNLEAYQTCFLDSLLNLSMHFNDLAAQHRHRGWIYQNNVYAAIQEYLSDVYPATKGVVGDDFFKQTVEMFVQEFPPHVGDLHRYGDQFRRYCETVQGLQALEYVFDLIEYEWALHCAYFAVISDSLVPDDLPQEDLLTLNVEFNESVCLIDSDYPIHDIHQQSLPTYTGTFGIDLAQSQDCLLVYKNQFAVESLLLSAEQMVFFKAIANKTNLLEAIEAMQDHINADTLSSTLSIVFTAKLMQLKLN